MCIPWIEVAVIALCFLLGNIVIMLLVDWYYAITDYPRTKRQRLDLYDRKMAELRRKNDIIIHNYPVSYPDQWRTKL